MGGGQKPRPTKAASRAKPTEQESGEMHGEVASFNPVKGFGFITCNSIDAYFKASDLVDITPETCVKQLQVLFDLSYFNGRPQAKNIRNTGDSAARAWSDE